MQETESKDNVRFALCYYRFVALLFHWNGEQLSSTYVYNTRTHKTHIFCFITSKNYTSYHIVTPVPRRPVDPAAKRSASYSTVVTVIRIRTVELCCIVCRYCTDAFRVLVNKANLFSTSCASYFASAGVRECCAVMWVLARGLSREEAAAFLKLRVWQCKWSFIANIEMLNIKMLYTLWTKLAL